MLDFYFALIDYLCDVVSFDAKYFLSVSYLMVLQDKKLQRSSSTLFLRHRGDDDYVEPDIPIKEFLTSAPSLLAEQCRLLSQELRETIWPKQRVFDATPIHGASLVQWKFDRQEVLDAFIVRSDSGRRVGYSNCEFFLSDRGTAIFKGNLDLRVPKDGQVFRAGYAAITSKKLMKSFNRIKTYKDWSLFTHLLLKVRGDGRTYLINLGTPGYFDVMSRDVYNYPLYTHGGPYWQYEKIPFSKFYLSTQGRIQDRQGPVTGGKAAIIKDNDIKYFGITICDRVEGPFELEIDWIGVQYDASHFEHFAYEMFDYPFNLD
ncbi:Probable complex I intermediate-associated protei n 30, mitochondrial [Trichuris trichiura]|uniref:Probable complex I intermediate-associated protei n 30, mitochondrial n=1 Tax=Trichuris trichiura TaxID=36087 RepID=A0A077Z3Q9_TRITR|nr:Probable complex I intermediate-associated protei n 30, mitochondrial [Trichuris trichiura]